MYALHLPVGDAIIYIHALHLPVGDAAEDREYQILLDIIRDGPSAQRLAVAVDLTVSERSAALGPAPTDLT
jgi:hypothetical protein